MVSLNLSLAPSFLKLFELIHIFMFRGLHTKGSLTYPCYHCQGQRSPEGGLQLHKLTQLTFSTQTSKEFYRNGDVLFQRSDWPVGGIFVSADLKDNQKSSDINEIPRRVATRDGINTQWAGPKSIFSQL